MNGAGNTNLFKNLDHKNRHLKWFYVYFGYSKKARQANVYVKWQDGEDTINYDQIDHYFVPQFFVYAGRDKHFPGWNGQLGLVNFNLGEGAFTKEFKNEKNIFGFDAPFTKRTVQPFDIKEREAKLLVSSTEQKTPTLEKSFPASQLEDITQYGYGFWCRFLQQYPV